MHQDPTHARPTAVAGASTNHPSGTLGQTSSGLFQPDQLRLIKEIATKRRSQLLRQGHRIALREIAETVLLEAREALSRHPNSLPLELRPFGDRNAVENAWRANYILASQLRGRHVWLAPRGTDFMPVRCLVASHHGEGRRDVQVVVIRASDDPDRLQVVTYQKLRTLKALAVNELGLRLREGLYWPSSRWARKR